MEKTTLFHNDGESRIYLLEQKGRESCSYFWGLKVIARAVIERFARFLEVKNIESALSGKPIR